MSHLTHLSQFSAKRPMNCAGKCCRNEEEEEVNYLHELCFYGVIKIELVMFIDLLETISNS